MLLSLLLGGTLLDRLDLHQAWMTLAWFESVSMDGSTIAEEPRAGLGVENGFAFKNFLTAL